MKAYKKRIFLKSVFTLMISVVIFLLIDLFIPVNDFILKIKTNDTSRLGFVWALVILFSLCYFYSSWDWHGRFSVIFLCAAIPAFFAWIGVGPAPCFNFLLYYCSVFLLVFFLFLLIRIIPISWRWIFKK